MPSITDIPVEVFIDNLLPLIPVADLLSLTCTNKFFAILCSDEMFWKRKLEKDFNFSPTGIARTSGFKFLYKGLRRPRVFVWGETANDRLGLTRPPQLSLAGVPYPVELRIPSVRIVSLVAGGMSFHALDSEGNVHVWGTMDGTTFALRSDGYSESGKSSEVPRKLEMPAPTRNISCGRLHSATLDANQHIWTFLNFGRPFRLSSPLLDNSSPETSPLQIECGWNLTSVLTKSGDVLVWWPFDGQMSVLIQQKHEEMNLEGNKQARAIDNTIPCAPWVLRFDPTRLPSLPKLPKLSNSADGGIEPQLIQIAALDKHIIGLTDHGHVVKFGSLSNEETVHNGRWEYLPNFSDVDMVRAHPVFSAGDDNQSEKRLEPPSNVKITHISGHFQHFVAYSTGPSSLVLMGGLNTGPSDQPNIIPALQYKSVISVVVGDYHYGALTSTGKLLTWGAYSSGALGLGDPTKLPVGAPGGFGSEIHRQQAMQRGIGRPPDVVVPTEVRFDGGSHKPKERFCFAVTASGWHTGALVIDLEPNSQDDDDTEADPLTSPGYERTDPARRTPGRFPVPLPQPPFSSSGPGQVHILPTGPAHVHDASAFRIGFPGREGTSSTFSQQGPSTSTLHSGEQQSAVPTEVPIPSLGPGRSIRIGFAGRGTNPSSGGRGQGGLSQS